MRMRSINVQLPRVELVEMGPRLDLSVRRRRDAPPDLAKEAHRQPKLTGKKVTGVKLGVSFRVIAATFTSSAS